MPDKIEQLTPQNVLREMVRQSPPLMHEQCELFLKMDIRDRQKLLFYQHMHIVALVQNLHSRIDAKEAATRPMSELATRMQS